MCCHYHSLQRISQFTEFSVSLLAVSLILKTDVCVHIHKNNHTHTECQIRTVGVGPLLEPRLDQALCFPPVSSSRSQRCLPMLLVFSPPGVGTSLSVSVSVCLTSQSLTHHAVVMMSKLIICTHFPWYRSEFIDYLCRRLPMVYK